MSSSPTTLSPIHHQVVKNLGAVRDHATELFAKRGEWTNVEQGVQRKWEGTASWMVEAGNLERGEV